MRHLSWTLLLCSLCGGLSAQSKDIDEALAAAKESVRSKRYGQAIVTLLGVGVSDDVRVRPLLIQALTRRGLARFGAGDFRQALKDYAAADRLDPGKESVLQSLGVISFNLKLRHDARDYMQRVLALNAKNANALAVLGRIAASYENLEKARDYFRRAAAAAPHRRDYARLAVKYSREAGVEKSFAIVERGNFKVMFERGKTVGVEKAIQSVLSLLEQAHRELASGLGARPARRFTVMIYNRAQFQRVNSAHIWARAYYDGKLRIAIPGWPDGREALRRDLRHELTHAFLHELFPNTPLWLHEGYAQILEGKQVSAAVNAFRNGRYRPLPIATFTGTFAKSRDFKVVRRGYLQSLAVVGYLLRSGNKRRFQSLLAEFRRGTKADQAVKILYGVELAQLVRNALR